MYNAASLAEVLRESSQFGFTTGPVQHDWRELKTRRDAYITKLNGIYKRNLESAKMRLLEGTASFVDSRTVSVNEQTFSSEHILIAVGGRPSLPSPAELPGVEHCISSDGFFGLQELPRRVAIVGGGYIGVELAGVLRSLGAQTQLFTRWKKLLSSRFDDLIVDTLQKEMGKQGIVHRAEQSPAEVRRDDSDGTLTIRTQDGQVFGPFDQVGCVLRTAHALCSAVLSPAMRHCLGFRCCWRRDGSRTQPRSTWLRRELRRRAAAWTRRATSWWTSTRTRWCRGCTRWATSAAAWSSRPWLSPRAGAWLTGAAPHSYILRHPSK
jgi:hypothetical protein